MITMIYPKGTVRKLDMFYPGEMPLGYSNTFFREEDLNKEKGKHSLCYKVVETTINGDTVWVEENYDNDSAY